MKGRLIVNLKSVFRIWNFNTSKCPFKFLNFKIPKIWFILTHYESLWLLVF